ncbi:MAG: hypothetical protein CL862_10795 [Cyanobium sp. NAT70]|nr:hypothetical protein [Cyanobium sp. NAT70]
MDILLDANRVTLQLDQLITIDVICLALAFSQIVLASSLDLTVNNLIPIFLSGINLLSCRDHTPTST